MFYYSFVVGVMLVGVASIWCGVDRKRDDYLEGEVVPGGQLRYTGVVELSWEEVVVCCYSGIGFVVWWLVWDPFRWVAMEEGSALSLTAMRW